MKINKVRDYERIEFLGDAILELVSSDFLFNKYPDMPEGELTKKRAILVCEPSLAFCARQLNVGKYLRLGKGEALTGGADRESILADCVESIIGAIYLDSNLENAKKFILNNVLVDVDGKHLFYDSKTKLQEIMQSKGHNTISYKLVKEEGPEHDKKFYVEVIINDIVCGQGVGRNKKSAEQNAASAAINAASTCK